MMKATIFKLGLVLLVFCALLKIPAIHAANSTSEIPALKDISIPVLCYHRILLKPTSEFDFTPTQLEAEFEYLKNHGYEPITAHQLMEYQKQPELFPTKPVVLSFDDAHISHYTQVLPLLKKYNFVATFFIITSAVGDHGNHQITWAELAEMKQAGMDIQSHTLTHPFLTKQLSTEDRTNYLIRLDNELVHSKKILEEKLGISVDLLAYPYGWFNHEVEEEAVKAGYNGIFTVNWGSNMPNENPLRIKRRVMDNSITLDHFGKILSAKALTINIVSPKDTYSYSQVPVIKFWLPNRHIHNITVIIRNTSKEITPDEHGIYTFSDIPVTSPGFYMIIVKGLDDKQNAYMGSWCFNYNPEPIEPNKSISNAKH